MSTAGVRPRILAVDVDRRSPGDGDIVIGVAGVVQRLELQPSKLMMRVRFPSPAPREPGAFWNISLGNSLSFAGKCLGKPLGYSGGMANPLDKITDAAKGLLKGKEKAAADIKDKVDEHVDQHRDKIPDDIEKVVDKVSDAVDDVIGKDKS
jgi:hypothetical protein